MLTTEECLDALAGAHPSLKEAQNLVANEWRPDVPPPTVMSSEFARALFPLADAMKDDELQSVFVCVEHVLSAGDDLGKDVVATGLLEAIVVASDTNKPGASRLITFLGPLAVAYCEEWKALTEGR